MRRIETIYAFVIVDSADGTEGIPSFRSPLDDTNTPMVGADMAMIGKLRPIAQRTAKDLNQMIEIVQFETRVHVSWIKP